MSVKNDAVFEFSGRNTVFWTGESGKGKWRRQTEMMD